MLEEDERQQLQDMADNSEMSDIRRRRAKTLLLADIGPLGPGIGRSELSNESGFSMKSLSLLINRAMEMGPIEAALGQSRIGRGSGLTKKRILSPESEAEIASLASTSDTPKTELARIYGIGRSTVDDIIRRQNNANER